MKHYITTVRAAREAWLLESKRRGLRPATLKSYRNQSEYIVKEYGDRRMAFIRPRIAQEWLLRLPVGTESKKDIKRVTDQIWRYYGQQPLFGRIPALERQEDREIEYYSLNDIEVMLGTAPDEMMVYLALGLFCGIRPMETVRLRAGDILPGGVRIRGAAAKTGLARFVQPVEHAWKVFVERYPFPVRNLPRRRRNLARELDKVGVRWIPDGLRHTFGTHYFNIHGPGDTARVLGHRSLDMLYRHYAGVADVEESREFFNRSWLAQ